jgi:hypothetical protein
MLSVCLHAHQLQLVPQIPFTGESQTARKSQSSARTKWVEARQGELLPVEYFHVVFTLPEPIARIAHYNRKEVYNILFGATAETLTTPPSHGTLNRLGILQPFPQKPARIRSTLQAREKDSPEMTIDDLAKQPQQRTARPAPVPKPENPNPPLTPSESCFMPPVTSSAPKRKNTRRPSSN